MICPHQYSRIIKAASVSVQWDRLSNHNAIEIIFLSQEITSEFAQGCRE